MDAQSKSIILPICTIQHDFQTGVIRDVLDGTLPEDKFWVSCYKHGEPSVHGKVSATLDEQNRDLVLFEACDGVEFKDYGKVGSICIVNAFIVRMNEAAIHVVEHLFPLLSVSGCSGD